MRRGLESDPRFVDPAKGDFRLASGSPARGAASDGGDLGARLDQIRDDPVDSVAWIRRHNGQTWLRQGRDAISAGDKAAALVLLKRASLMLPEHPEIPELLRRASE